MMNQSLKKNENAAYPHSKYDKTLNDLGSFINDYIVFSKQFCWPSS